MLLCVSEVDTFHCANIPQFITLPQRKASTNILTGFLFVCLTLLFTYVLNI